MTWAKLWFGVRKEENLEGGACIRLSCSSILPLLSAHTSPSDARAESEPGAPQSATLSLPLSRRSLRL